MYVLLRTASFFLICYGILKLFQFNQKEFQIELVTLFSPKPESIAFKINLAKGKKQRGRLSQLIYETKEILNLVGKQSEFPLVCFSAFLLTLLVVLFCVMSNNLILILPFSMITIAGPFVYIRQRGIRLKKMINEELETALSIITNSYIRNENIILAVEENINYIHYPIKEIFAGFIFNCDYVSSDIRQNLKKLKMSIDNSVFQEWCDALTGCQNDSSLRYTLTSIVKKLSYIRIVSVRLDSVLYEPVREFIFMVIILLFNFPIFYVLNKQWYKILTDTVYGHFTIALVFGIIAFCFANVLKLTRPVEYQR